MIEHKLKLKFDDSFNGVLFSTQGDTGRVFEIEVRDELDNAIDITGHKLEFYVGNDSKVTKVEASISGNKFIVKPVNEQFTKAGLNKAQFVLYDAQGLQVGSQIFDLHVEESIQQGATVGSNVIVDFTQIQEAVKLIKGYEKTFEESKNLDTTLSAHIDEGKKVNQELISNTSAAKGVDANLKISTTKASETYTKLEESRTNADTLNNDLKSNIAQGNKTNANLQASISTAKNTQSALQEKTAQGLEVNKSLGQSIKTGQGIVSSINAADKGLADKIATADTSKTNLDKSINTANKSKADLDASKAQAESTKIGLDSSNSTATSNKTSLDESIGKAETAKSNLDTSKAQADSTKTALDKSIKTGQEVNAASETNKLNLDQSIKDAKDAKVQLDKSTGKANTAKSNVDASTATADAKNTELISTTSTATSTDEAAKKTITQLQALLSQSSTTEQNLKDIIASGNLDKYITDPKLQEALKDYVTTSNLSTELANYVKSADLANQLDNKVDKVTGKTLTSNDFTNAYKSKLDDLTKITKVSQLTNDLNYITDLKMQEALTKIKTLKKEVVNQLPATGQDDIIYLIKDAKGKTKNIYLEYLWINNDFELIGSTQVDLTGYAKTSEVDSKLSGKVDKESGKALSSNDYTSAEKTKLSSINPSDYAKQSDISSAKAKSNKSNINVFTDRSTSYTSLDIILGDLELRTEQNRDNKANKTDIKTKLSEMIDDSTHRTVTDSEKSTWNNKLSSVSGVDISRSKTKGYNTSSTWQPLSTNRDLEDWIGDFDKRTRENQSNIGNKANKSDLTSKADKSELSNYAKKSDMSDFKRCKVLTQSEYDALSSAEKNRDDTLYFIKA